MEEGKDLRSVFRCARIWFVGVDKLEVIEDKEKFLWQR